MAGNNKTLLISQSIYDQVFTLYLNFFNFKLEQNLLYFHSINYYGIMTRCTITSFSSNHYLLDERDK